MWRSLVVLTGCLAATCPGQDAVEATAKASPETHLPKLAAPFQVEVDGVPIACVSGHAAPFVVDMDGDGLWDLVVGEFGSSEKGVRGGTCRVYLNQGTATAPRFGTFTLLQSEGKSASMESG